MEEKKTQTGDVSAKDLFKAIQFAAIKQKRSNIAINIDVAKATGLLALVGEKDKVLLQAILLHDLVDWTNTSLNEIQEEFGANVASLIEEKGGQFGKGGQLTWEEIESTFR